MPEASLSKLTENQATELLRFISSYMPEGWVFALTFCNGLNGEGLEIITTLPIEGVPQLLTHALEHVENNPSSNVTLIAGKDT